MRRTHLRAAAAQPCRSCRQGPAVTRRQRVHLCTHDTALAMRIAEWARRQTKRHLLLAGAGPLGPIDQSSARARMPPPRRSFRRRSASHIPHRCGARQPVCQDHRHRASLGPTGLVPPAWSGWCPWSLGMRAASLVSWVISDAVFVCVLGAIHTLMWWGPPETRLGGAGLGLCLL